MLTSEEATTKARQALASDENVLLAYLFGSTVKGLRQPISDIDIAVLLKDDSLESQAGLIAKLAKALRMPEDKVDLVDLGRAPLHLKYRVLREGIKLTDRGFEEGLLKELVERYPDVQESLNMALRSWLREDPHIDPAIIQKRVDEVLRNAALIRDRYATKPLDQILADPEKTLALERALERLIEAMVDTCRHVVSTRRLGLIETQAEYPLRIADHGQMPRELAEKISELSRLRNILTHRYLDVDYAKLYAKAKETAEQTAPKFTEWAKGLLTTKQN